MILELWDNPGQERYTHVIKLFIKDCDCVVLGYDITRKKTFDEIRNFWLAFAKENTWAKLLYLIGNICDFYMEEEVPENVVKEYAEENNLRFFLVSCKKHICINEFLSDLGNELLKL